MKALCDRRVEEEGAFFPWRHMTAAVQGSYWSEAEASTLGCPFAAPIDKQSHSILEARVLAITSMANLLDRQFRDEAGSEDVASWELVTLKDWWLIETVVGDVTYIDATYCFRKRSG